MVHFLLKGAYKLLFKLISDIIKTNFPVSTEFLNTSNKAFESLHHKKETLHTRGSVFIFPSSTIVDIYFTF